MVNLSEFISGCCLCDARLIAALLRQHGPGDPCQLVGEGRSQNVRMQALSGTNEPGTEPFFGQFAGRNRMTRAACMKSMRE